MEKQKLLLYLATFFLLAGTSSCEVLKILFAPTPSEELIRKLELDYTWRSNLIQQTVLEGKISSSHSKEISGIEIKAIFYDTGGAEMGTETISVGTPVTPDGVVTFKEKFSYTAKVGNIRAVITAARD